MLNFTKMQGLGNDFVVLDCRAVMPERPRELARALCNRRTGVGADGLLCLCPSDRAAVRMAVFNADGSEAETCGNGLRCVGRWLREHGAATGETALVETAGTVRRLTVPERGPVTADMGTALVGGTRGISVKGKAYTAFAASVGNPHLVLLCGDLPALALAELGAAEPDANLEAVRLVCRERIELRIWERGCGETPACGTGACAAAAALRTQGLLGDWVTVAMPGGQAEVRFDSRGGIALTAPAVTVFEGRLEAEWKW